MRNSDGLWYDYETEEPSSPTQERWHLLRTLALIAATVAGAYTGYIFIA